MNLMIPVRPDGSVEPRFGKAPMVAVATLDQSGEVTDWQTFQVDWDRLHDEGTEGSHHARIVRFLRDHDVDAVVATHVGPGMQRTLTSMGLPMLPATDADARTSVVEAVRRARA
ncbi:NifB/NifX family molybdenum-iron cluster-binding protein [Acidipropionibacterium timonense]|uniref:NifB/NifX family molybdenum-iron cluster-binding protein n=1 Tax=Acidipropionibacterium timonense TaxID=2161818 RepID=UPI0010320218|nr:NifB/NifX family molybdenum-iron cluster-binding protein [Acidipropionibacterium timonense]